MRRAPRKFHMIIQGVWGRFCCQYQRPTQDIPSTKKRNEDFTEYSHPRPFVGNSEIPSHRLFFAAAAVLLGAIISSLTSYDNNNRAKIQPTNVSVVLRGCVCGWIVMEIWFEIFIPIASTSPYILSLVRAYLCASSFFWHRDFGPFFGLDPHDGAAGWQQEKDHNIVCQ